MGRASGCSGRTSLLARRCAYSEIQPAVNASHNNDRVVVMPGVYTEPTSRAQPLNDPRCADMTQEDSGGAKTPSYRYQVNCPNDQNLVHIQGRAVPDTPPPSPPLTNRQGIPDLGPCVRCNLQLEGSGVLPTDVIIDGASDYESDDPEARPHTFHKHVIVRADRADGFVAHNFTVRGALEHGLYIEETDGYRVDTVKMFWNADYGNLTFTSDHGLYTDCDGMGAGDAVLYPGGAPETGEQADKSFYPDAPRINTVVRNCDMRGSVLAYSGSMGNAVRITHNNIYGNTAGISTDTISAGGHPGFPADSVQIDHNYIYSNNLELFKPDAPVPPRVGILPVGVGIFWAGHNNGSGVRQLDLGQLAQRRLPALDPRLPRDPGGQHQPGRLVRGPEPCPRRAATGSSGISSAACRRASSHSRSCSRSATTSGATRGVAPNGVDFWWDEGGVGPVVKNCWFGNVGPDGTAASVTGPGVGDGNDVLPSDCATSTSAGDPVKVAYLLSCFLAREGEAPPEQCDWYTLPPKPGSTVRRAQAGGVRGGRARVPPDGPREAARGPHRRADGDPVPRP